MIWNRWPGYQTFLLFIFTGLWKHSSVNRSVPLLSGRGQKQPHVYCAIRIFQLPIYSTTTFTHFWYSSLVVFFCCITSFGISLRKGIGKKGNELVRYCYYSFFLIKPVDSLLVTLWIYLMILSIPEWCFSIKYDRIFNCLNPILFWIFK